MNILKRIFNAYITAKEFEINMNIMDSLRPTKEKYRVEITLDQMNALTTLASYGATVDDFERAFRLLSVERRDEISGD